MKQKLLKTWLMLCLLLVGVGTTWATDESITLANGVGTGSGTSYSITWSGTSCDITQTKESSSTSVNSSYISAPRWYQNHKIAFKAKSGFTLTGVTVKCTSNTYATALKTSTYSTNASATVSNDVVTITTSGDFDVTLSAQSRISSVTVSYTTSGGGGSTPSTPVAVTGVSLDKTSLDLKVGKTATLTAAVAPSNADNKKVKWTSNNTNVATVEDGLVTAVAEGSAVITVETEDGKKTATCNVSVSAFTASYANTFTSAEGILTVEGGTSASAAKVIWQGESFDAIKAGTSSVAGVIKVTVPAGTKTLHVHLAGWNNEGKGVTVTGLASEKKITIKPDTGVSGSSPFTLASDPETDHYYAIETNNAEDVTLTFTATTGKRFVLFGVNAEKGEGGDTPTPEPTKYNVTIASGIANGTVTASPTSAAAGATVTLTANPATGYEFVAWDVKDADNTAITVTENKFTMPAQNVTVSATFKEIPPAVFASLAELVAADVTAGTNVTVSFEKVPIKEIYVTNAGYRNGVYFDIQKDGKDIEIFYQNVPEEWVVGGTLSGTMTCPWKLYNGTWELAPAKDTWAWTNLAYAAPEGVSYTIIVDEGSIANGTVTASAEKALAGATVTLTATPNEGYVFEAWDVKAIDNSPITVTDNKFSMPAQTVFVSATFKKEAANVTFDLTKDETVAASDELLAWTSAYASMYAEKASASTATNNYYPGTENKSYTSTRFYTNSTLTFNPAPGVTITSVVYEATTEDYAAKFKNSTWTNATATANGTTVTITPTDGTKLVSVTLGNTVGASSVKVYYTGEPTDEPTYPGSTDPEPTTYTITVSDAIANGTVTASASSAEEGKAITLTATPADGYEFEAWDVKDADNTAITVTDNKFTMPAKNVTVSATFKEIVAVADKTIAEFIAAEGGECYLTGVVSNITNTAYGNFDLTDESGTIYIYGCLDTEGAAKQFATLGVEAGDKIKVLANTYELYQEKPEAKNVVFVEMVEKGAVATYNVAVAGDIENGKVKVSAQNALEGTVITLTATPNEGYEFEAWSVKGADNATITVTDNKFNMPAQAVTVSATFKPVAAEPDNVIFDLSKNETVKATEKLLAWTSTCASMYAEKASASTATNNYYPGTENKSYTSTRFYTNSTLTFNPAPGVTITSVVYEATTEDYATKFKNSTWTNATAKANGTTVTITPTDGTKPVVATLTGTTGAMSVKIYYTGEPTEAPYVPSGSDVDPEPDPEPVDYAISVNDYIYNGSVTVSTTMAKTGDVVTLTATPAEGYELFEYIVTRADNNEEITVSDNKFTMPAADVNVTAIFQLKGGDVDPDPEPTPDPDGAVTYTFGEFTQGNDVTLEAADFTITLHKNNGTTAPRWNADAAEARVYAKGSVDVASTKNIVKVVYDYVVNANNNGTAPTIVGVAGATVAGTWSADTKTWEGKDKTVTLTTSGTAGNLGFKSIKVYFDEGAETYAVNISDAIQNGTVTADKETAEQGTVVTLTATPADGYEFTTWNVTNAATSESISVTANQFTMPAANVNVSATFKEIKGDEPSGDKNLARFIFNTDEGLAAIGIAKPEASNGTDLGSSDYTSGAITLTATDGGTHTRVWNSNGATSLRVYKDGGSLTFSGANITNIAFTGTVSAMSADKGTYDASTKTWIGEASSVTFTASGSVTINTISVTYAGGDVPASDPKIPNFVKTASIELETGAANYDVRECLNIPADYDADTYAITTTIDGVTEKDGEFACVYPYLAFQKAGTYTVTVTAAAMPGKYAETKGTITVKVKEPLVEYASLEDLVAADIATGTTVTVSFENVPIKEIFATTTGYRNGVYFDIQKDGKDIEIYYQNVPEEWVVGGKLSGTMTCPWKKYSGTWELAPNKDTWAWSNLTYTAPDAPVVVAPVFDVAGGSYAEDQLVLINNYSDNYLYAYTVDSTDPAFDAELNVINGVEYDNNEGIEITYSCTLKAIAVDIDGNISTITSADYVMLPKLASITISGTPAKTEYYAGEAFETAGLVVTGTYADSHQEVITEDIEWTVDPETLTLGTTSVDVMAGVGSIVSEVYTVNGLTVTEDPYMTARITSFSETFGNMNDDIAYEAFKGDASTAPVVNSNNLRLYQNGCYVTVTAKTGLKIASVKITTGATYASTTVGYCVDDEDAPTTGETVAKSSDYTISGLNNSSVSIYCLGTDKNSRLEIAAIEVKYSGNVVAELSDIALSGTYPTEFTKGAEFSHEGMTVTANYTDGNDKDVTSAVSFTGYDMNTIGEQTVTVSYTEDGITKTAEYTINVSKAPFVPTPAVEGYEAVDFTTLEPYKSLGTNGNAVVEDYEGTSFAMVFAKPESSTNPTKYYYSGASVRAYKGNTITITAAEKITNVDIAWSEAKGEDAGVTIEGIGTETAVITFSTTCSFTDITVYYQQYTRSLTNAWGTICLPYDFKADATTTYYSIAAAQIENDNPVAMALTKETDLKAGVPYIFCSSNTEAGLTCARAGKTVATEPSTVNGMTGSFDKHEIAAGMYLLSGNKFVKVATGSNVGANRAYIDMSHVPTSSNVKADVIFGFNGDITDGILNVESNGRNAQYFDMSGRRVMNPVKGLYIVNGKKVMK